jgi:hypothetical protein
MGAWLGRETGEKGAFEEEAEEDAGRGNGDVGQARTGRGIHGVPKVSCGLAMPDPYTPSGRATPQTAIFFPLGYPFPYGPDLG